MKKKDGHMVKPPMRKTLCHVAKPPMKKTFCLALALALVLVHWYSPGAT